MPDRARRERRLRPLAELTRVRVLEFIREPEALFWVFIFPVLLALALGIAFRSKAPDKLRVALTGTDAAAIERSLAESPFLTVVRLDPAGADEALRKGRVDAVVVAHGAGAPVVRYDAVRADGRAARLAVGDALAPKPARLDNQLVAEPGSRYIDFLIPGLIGLNLMGSGMWGIGFAVVVARTRKLLKRFAATPMRRSDYLLSFACSRLIFLFLELAALVAFGWLVFDVRVRGSFLALAVVAFMGAASFAGLGLLVAARPRSIEAVSGWMNFVMLPMWLLSGTFFSYERFPAVVRPAIRLLPLTALNDAMRAVMNDGASLVSTWPALLVMLVWTVASFVVALRIFRWQ
jgi:ABC-2 type transport system permease protein